ncbi:MAG: hypothetical protein ACREDX_10070, partial [Aestuariivirga sp.]
MKKSLKWIGSALVLVAIHAGLHVAYEAKSSSSPQSRLRFLQRFSNACDRCQADRKIGTKK